MFRKLKIPIIMLLLLSLFACAPGSQTRQSGDREKKADVHYKLALAHLQAKRPTLALKELLAAVQKDPDNSSIQIALAQTYQQKKAFRLAEKHYFKALKLSPKDPRYQNNLATLYLDMERWDKAIDYFDRAAKNLLFVNAHVALAGKSFAYFKKKDYPAALNYVSEAIASAPRYASAYFLKSQVYGAMDDVEQEKYFLRRAIELAPQFMRARYYLADLLVRESLPKEAAKELEIIIEFTPTSELGYKAKSLLKSLPGS